MDPLLWDWVGLLVRWLHVIAGIAWIGSSFYFIHLDASLRNRGGLPEGVSGEAWQVHGGGFYRMQKYVVAPADLPDELTWFKWEAYTTWLSGAALMVVVYYLGAEVFLIDRDVLDLPVWAAIAISIGSLALGWLGYDLLCKSKLGADDARLGAILFVLLVAAAWAYAQVFSGRAAYIHVGALIGTMMVANVFVVIIPNQKVAVAELVAGREPEPALGRQAKQRSLHNNYLTLPVVFTMISIHYPMTFGSRWSWLIFAGVLTAGGLVRHFYNLRHAGRRPQWWLWPAAAACIALIALISMSRPQMMAQGEAAGVTFADVQPVFAQRCAVCHASDPVMDGFDAPPAGVVLETPEQIWQRADAIHAQSVLTDAMPPGNLTGITDAERRLGRRRRADRVSCAVITRRALRGRVVYFTDDPADAGADAVRDHPDGLLLLEDGRIKAVGDAREVVQRIIPGTPVDHWPGCLIMPGLIDTHVHYPQTQVIASYGSQLLEWLTKYAFVEEQKFEDKEHCRRIARFFLDELQRSGTTTACVYCTVHPQSAELFFEEAERRQLRMIAGKVMMDRGAPAALTDTAEFAYADSRALLGRWHGRDRLGYAITPRFAVTCSDAELEAAGALAREFPDAFVQTHLGENHEEIRTVARLFPWARHYTEVYDRYGLLGPRTILGHCLHLDDDEIARLSERRSVAAFCPTSNLFMGNGLFDLARFQESQRPVRVSLATDVGGGTSYSMLRTAAEAYKVLQLQDQDLPPLEAFYLMTLGNARALGLEDRIGSLAPGCEADVVVLDPRATPAMAHRMETVESDLARTLFVLMTMGDDRAVRATYVLGGRTSLEHRETAP